MQGGGALMVNRGGKQVPWQSKGFNVTFERGFDGTNYTFRHLIKKSAVFDEPGEIAFRGLYRIELGEPLSVARIVRRAGETLRPLIPRVPNARVNRVIVDSFIPSTGPNQSNIVVHEDVAQIHVVFQRDAGLSRSPNRALTRIYDVEVVDEKGQIYQSDQKGKFRFQGLQHSSAEDALRTRLQPGKDVGSINVYLDPFFRPRHELKLRGKISVEEGWPMPFEIALTPHS